MSDLLEKGIELVRRVENEKAIKVFEKILETDSTNPEVYRHLGLAQFNLGHHSEALKNLNRCLDLDPTHHQTWWNLGQLYEILGNIQGAHHAYLKAEYSVTNDPVKAARYHEWVKKTQSLLKTD